jgi:transposase-like protein
VRFTDQPLFRRPSAARKYLERRRWADGVYCPHCGLVGESSRLRPRRGSRSPGRAGLRKCNGCRRQFTVTVGTIFARSRVPLHIWLRAILRLCDCYEPASAADLVRVLPITYHTARYIRDRVRAAMRQEPLRTALLGIPVNRSTPNQVLRRHTGKGNRRLSRTSLPLPFERAIDLLLRVGLATSSG